MSFSVGIFNAQLRQMGQDVLWRPSRTCPCRNLRDGSGSPDSACPQCQGKGVIWAAPIPAWTGVSGQRQVREWAKFGMWQSGDEVLSIPSDSPLYEVGENDRILMTQTTEPFSIVLERTGAEKIPFPVVSISSVFWLADDTRDIVQGPIPTVEADGSIVWQPPAPDVVTDTGQIVVTGQGTPIAATGDPAPSTAQPITSGQGVQIITDTGLVIAAGAPLLPPMVGADDSVSRAYVNGQPFVGPGPYPVEVGLGRPSSGQYTVTGRRNPEYFCFKDIPQDRAHFGGMALPRKCVARRFDLFGL